MSDSTQLSLIARQLIGFRGASYARDAAPTSPHPRLSGNRTPEITPLTWLQGKNKCNQFIGDVLSYAGYEMPTLRMADNSLHYANAERLPDFQRHFENIREFSSLRPGDILVLDWSARRGENGAHVEMITAINSGNGDLTLAGAGSQGASEKIYPAFLRKLSWRSGAATWYLAESRQGSANVYFLRPAKAAG